MDPLKSEVHHWWPRSVSAYWNDNEGAVNWIKPDGEVRRAPAHKFGAIKNGHHFKPDLDGKPDPWDFTFEPVFAGADDKFPGLVEWLLQLECKQTPLRSSMKEGFLAQNADDESISTLVECIVSLVVRSPKFRETGAAIAESFRGPLGERERNALISANIMHCQRRIADGIGTSGKFVVLFTHEREFHFGDGFYHNLNSQTQNGFDARIVVPITPNVAVFYCRPNRFRTEPRLMTLLLSEDEVTLLNNTVQIYSCECLFYRQEKPVLLPVYKDGNFRRYGTDDPLDDWVQEISGCPPEPSRIHFLG